MNQMTEPSMYERPEKPDWPLNALPLVAVERILALMSATYGSRFASLWSGTDPIQMQKVWGVELAKLSDEQRKAGISSLTALPKAPTLPEFIAHCKQARLDQATFQAPRLEHVAPADQKVIDANLAQIKRFSAPKRLSAANPGWAYDFLIRGNAVNGQETSVEVMKSCRDAILSTVGREYPSTQQGERAKQCAEILRKVLTEQMEA